MNENFVNALEPCHTTDLLMYEEDIKAEAKETARVSSNAEVVLEALQLHALEAEAVPLNAEADEKNGNESSRIEANEILAPNSTCEAVTLSTVIAKIRKREAVLDAAMIVAAAGLSLLYDWCRMQY